MLRIEVREDSELGSRASAKLRKEGFVPGIFYGRDMENLRIKVDRRLLEGELRKGSRLIDLEYAVGKRQESVKGLVREVQHDPTTDEILHIDLNAVAMGEKITISVSLEMIGDCPGVQEGGAPETHIHEIELECLPDAIPASIEVDISNVNIGDSILVKDLVVPEGVTLTTDLNQTVFSVHQPLEEAVPSEGEPVEEPEMIQRQADAEGEEESAS